MGLGEVGKHVWTKSKCGTIQRVKGRERILWSGGKCRQLTFKTQQTKTMASMPENKPKNGVKCYPYPAEMYVIF